MPRRGVATAHAAGSSAATAFWPFQGGVIMSETSGSISGLTDEEAQEFYIFFQNLTLPWFFPQSQKSVTGQGLRAPAQPFPQ